MFLPILPPRVAWLATPLPGLKKANIPQAAKAKGIPPSHHFQYLVKSENCPLTIIQITTPVNMAVKANPIPKSSSSPSQVVVTQVVMSSQVAVLQLVICGQNQIISPTMMIASNSSQYRPQVALLFLLGHSLTIPRQLR